MKETVKDRITDTASAGRVSAQRAELRLDGQRAESAIEPIDRPGETAVQMNDNDRVRELAEQLNDAEVECEALWEENRRLKDERSTLLGVIEEVRPQLDECRREIGRYHEALTSIHRTLAWRLLNRLRRLRDALLRR